MKRRTEPSAKLQIHIPAALKAAVEREAREDRRTMSVCVELALVEHFKAKEATT
jgi:hypothetical protein